MLELPTCSQTQGPDGPAPTCMHFNVVAPFGATVHSVPLQDVVKIHPRDRGPHQQGYAHQFPALQSVPWIENLVERLEMVEFISTIDQGCLLVALNPDAPPKNTFSTASDHWKYHVLSFGLHGPEAHGYTDEAIPDLCSLLSVQCRHPLHLVQ